MVALCPQGYVELICYPLGSCEAPLEEAHSPLYPRALPQHLDERPPCSAQRKSWRRWRIPLASCNCRVFLLRLIGGSADPQIHPALQRILLQCEVAFLAVTLQTQSVQLA